jgi:hypothetical protein
MLKYLHKNTQNFYKTIFKNFTGKTETGWKFTTPRLRMKSITPISPPPGENLELPSKCFFKFIRMDNSRVLRKDRRRLP